MADSKLIYNNSILLADCYLAATAPSLKELLVCAQLALRHCDFCLGIDSLKCIFTFCVVPHFRKTGEWTATVNMNFGSAIEYALNEGKSLMTGKQMGLPEQPACTFKSYEDVENAFFKQFKNLCYHSVVLTTTAQRIHKEKDGSDLL